MNFVLYLLLFCSLYEIRGKVERWGEEKGRHLFFAHNRIGVMIHFLMPKFLLWTEQKTLLNLNLGKQWNDNESYEFDIIYRKYVCFFIF